MERQEFANVWDALADSPQEAANMAMRSSLLIAIQQKVQGWNVAQAVAARRLGVTQPRLNDLLRSKIGRFSSDMLVALPGLRCGWRLRRCSGDGMGCGVHSQLVL